jgi:AraC-like DNA-binding protein
MPTRDRFSEFATRLQLAIGLLPLLEPDEADSVLLEICTSLPEFESVGDTVLLRALLIEFASRFGEFGHARCCRPLAVRCAFVPAALPILWVNNAVNVRVNFARWLRRLLLELRAAHPLTIPSRAAAVIRKEFRQPLSLITLANRVNAGFSQLQRGFAREYWMSIHRYQRLCRLKAALEHIGSVQIAAFALEVGYKSKKDFYRVFLSLTSLTPAAFRRLSVFEANRIRDSIQLALIAGCRRA